MNLCFRNFHLFEVDQGIYHYLDYSFHTNFDFLESYYRPMVLIRILQSHRAGLPQSLIQTFEQYHSIQATNQHLLQVNF